MLINRRHPLAMAVSTAVTMLAVSPLLQAEMLWDDSKVERIEVHGQAEDYRVQNTTTATKTNTLLRDIPQSISVVTDELIADQSMQNMGDVLRYVPGVQMAQGEGHRDAPVLRGNTSTADFFVNGVRDDVQYFRDLYNVERVEVLKGPSGMIFGRGGAGGLINRVTKQANWSEQQQVQATIGAWGSSRASTDINKVLDEQLAVRLTAMYEDSDSYRDYANLQRKAVNPTLTFKPSDSTHIAFSYEHFADDRVTDRGIPSHEGRPIATDRSTFFGKPADSFTTAQVDAFSTTISHEFQNGLLLSNQTRYANYDKYYANVMPGAFNASKGLVSISGYGNQTDRKNLMNQTDLTLEWSGFGVEHTLLAGAEFNRQQTDNFRHTAYFTALGANVTAATVTLADPIYTGPVEFRQSATDANNHGIARTRAVYLQDQLELSANWQAVVGVRYDHFSVDLLNNRNGSQLSSSDSLLSPRAGLIYKPQEQLSIYANYSLSYVPRAGEQLASLTASNKALEPEQFRNQEIGLKWDLNSQLSFTSALYQLQRSNVAVSDPSNPALSILVDGQQVRGLELEINGHITDAWQIIAGYAQQHSEVQTPGSTNGNLLPQVPKHSFSLWNRYSVNEQWSAGLGWISQSASYAHLDNTVTLPGFGRLDAGVFYQANSDLKLQLNLENLLDKHYYASAHNNNNITPAAPRSARFGVSYQF